MKKQFSVMGRILFLSMFLAFVGTAQESTPTNVAASIGDSEKDFPDDIHKLSASDIRKISQGKRAPGTGPHPVLIRCFEERSFHYTGGKYENAEIRYRLHMPKNISYGRKYPLIVYLHGVGESGSNNTSSLIHLQAVLPVLVGAKREDCFMLVTQCPRETPYWSFQTTKDGTLDVLMAAMEHVIANNPIDERRITATGVSSGGTGVWNLILRHPDTFAGAVPTACNAPSQHKQLAALKNTPVWAFVNKGDRQVNPQSSLLAKRVINKSGGSMAFTECDATGHNAWSPAMENYNSFRWMIAQKRGSWFSPLPGTVVQKPTALLLALAMYLLPLAIIIFLWWNTICEQTFNAYQMLRERFSKQ
jgi:predicted esterase